MHDAKDKNRLRTFPSLMSTPYELDLLEWHATGQLALIDVQAAAPRDPKAKVVKMAPGAGLKKIGQPAMIRSLDVSPDGKYVRVTRMTTPFSYIVPGRQFRIGRRECGTSTARSLAKVTDRPLNLGTSRTRRRRIRRAAGGGGAASRASARSRGATTARG